MKMAPIKLVILRNNLSYLMGEVTELDEEPYYLLTGCMLMEGDKFTPFPLHTEQRDCFLTSDVILTIVDPSKEAITNYKKAL